MYTNYTATISINDTTAVRQTPTDSLLCVRLAVRRLYVTTKFL